ncbi:MAG: squalene/phytoene synthase family protein [Ahrensia sp.]|nr:squalene/phytoene synthase family protein [Ahrensia sp.]
MHDAAPLLDVMAKISPILDILRQNDRDAYVSTLFVPDDKRSAIASIWAFNAEIERIPQLVSEPFLGEIRLQWWRDVCNGARSEEGGQHPVAAALLDTISKYNLPVTAFDNLCDARIFDLYNDIIPSKADFEGYLGHTRSLLFQMCAQILGGGAQSADASGHARYGLLALLNYCDQWRIIGQKDKLLFRKICSVQPG